MTTWEEQRVIGNRRPGVGIPVTVERMNEIVTPCPPTEHRLWGLIRFERSGHRYVDWTGALNTLTYTTLHRCDRCGHMRVFIGDY